MANCYYHSRKEAQYTCKSCQKEICTACSIQVEGEPYCQICWEGYIADVKNRQEEESGVSLGIPWARWRELGVINAFLFTLSQAAFQPRRFFENLPAKTNFGTPFIFALLCVLLFWLPMNLAYFNAMVSLAQKAALPEQISSDSEIMALYVNRLQSLSHFGLVFQYLFSYILVASLLQHAVVFLLNGKKGYAATFQIRCYAMSAQFLQIIPIFGIFLAEMLTILVCARGFQVVQGISWPRAIFVSAFPLLFALLILTILI